MKRHIIVCTFQMSPEKSQKSLQQHSLQNQQNNSQHQIGDRSRKNQQQRPQSSNTYSRGGRGGFERGGPRGGRGAPADKHAYYGKLTKMCDLGICTICFIAKLASARASKSFPDQKMSNLCHKCKLVSHLLNSVETLIEDRKSN